MIAYEPEERSGRVGDHLGTTSTPGRTDQVTIRPIPLNDRLLLGAGRPKIVAALTGITEDQVLDQAGRAAAADADVLEWRIDLFADHTDTQRVLACLHRLADGIGPVPLLATVRTTAEGGAARLDGDGYLALVTAVAESGRVALVDVEHHHPRAVRAIEELHRIGVLVVGSHHDFERTPPVEVMEGWLDEQERLGCDVCKIAVMPHSPADLAALLCATARRAQTGTRPLITMSMGPLGVASRLIGGEVGSCASFASVGNASAPGQLPIAQVRAVWDVLESARR